MHATKRFIQISRNLINPYKWPMSHDIQRLPRSLGLTQPSWWRASASLRLRLVWLVHVNINLWCLLVTFPLFIFGESLDQLAQSGWQKGRILTAVHAYIYIYYDIDLEIYFNFHFDIMTHFKVGTEWVTKGQNIDQSYQSVAGIARGLYGRAY